MKTLFSTLAVLLFCNMGYSQIPSINETKSTGLIDIIRDAAMIEALETKFEKMKKNIPPGTVKDTSFVNIDKELQNAKISLLRNVPIRKRVYDSYAKTYDVLIQRESDSVQFYTKKLETAIGLKNQDKMKQKIDEKIDEVDKLKAEREAKLELVDGFDATFPTMNKKNRERFFHEIYNNNTKKTSYLNSFALSADGKNALAQSEIITDNMWAFRVAFGTVVNALSKKSEEADDATEKADLETGTESETDEGAFERLLNGGGNFYLEMILPLFVTNPNNGDQVTSYGYLSTKGAMDVKGFGNDIDTNTANGSAGFNYYLGISSDSKRFNFFLFGNAHYTFGTQDFYKNLGMQEAKGFLNGKIIVGVTFLNKFKLSAVVQNFGSDEILRNNKVSVGIQILPEF